MTILDADGQEVKPPPPTPEWHKDVKIGSLMCWQGHWFTFYGIDPEHDPDVIMFKWKEPTKATKRRKNAT
jgi:hypothetical protein